MKRLALSLLAVMSIAAEAHEISIKVDDVEGASGIPVIYQSWHSVNLVNPGDTIHTYTVRFDICAQHAACFKHEIKKHLFPHSNERFGWHFEENMTYPYAGVYKVVASTEIIGDNALRSQEQSNIVIHR